MPFFPHSTGRLAIRQKGRDKAGGLPYPMRKNGRRTQKRVGRAEG